MDLVDPALAASAAVFAPALLVCCRPDAARNKRDVVLLLRKAAFDKHGLKLVLSDNP